MIAFQRRSEKPDNTRAGIKTDNEDMFRRVKLVMGRGNKTMMDFKKLGFTVDYSVNNTGFDDTEDLVFDTAIEIKAALFYMLSDAIPKLVDETGELPSFVGKNVCDIVGCSWEELLEFICIVRLNEHPDHMIKKQGTVFSIISEESIGNNR